MNPEHWIGIGLFILGVALNAGVVWKGLAMVEKAVEDLEERMEENSITLGRMDSETNSLRKDIERMKNKVYGPQ